MSEQYKKYQDQLDIALCKLGTKYEKITFLAEGADHYVFSLFLSGKNMVARMPKNQTVVQCVKTESSILQDFVINHAQFSKDKVPFLKFIDCDTPFTISQQFPGQTWDKIGAKITTCESPIINDFSSVLAEFHSYKGVKTSLLEPVKLKKPLELFHEVSSIFNAEEINVIRKSLVLGLKNTSEKNTMVPLHYDLGPSNVMVDIIQNKMTGIIDFTGCKMGDNHFDLARVRQMLETEDSWNLFRKQYERKSGLTINTNKALFFGIWTNLDAIATKLQKNDIPERINGAKKRTLILCNKLNMRADNNLFFFTSHSKDGA